jgi:hypothetical protein
MSKPGTFMGRRRAYDLFEGALDGTWRKNESRSRLSTADLEKIIRKKPVTLADLNAANREFYGGRK